MDARKKKTLLTIISLGTLFLAWRMYSLMDRVSPASAGATPVASVEELQDPDKTTRSCDLLDPAILEAQRRVADQPWGRDPFDSTPFVVHGQQTEDKPAEIVAEKPPPNPNIRFTGVSKTGDQWLAAVEGTIARVGDTVQDRYKVAAISRNSITLSFEGWAFHFELGSKEPIVRRQSEKP